MAQGCRTNQTFEQDRVVDGSQGIVSMQQCDFELARGVLGHQCSQRQPLRSRTGINFIEQRRHLVQLAQSIRVQALR